MGRLELSRDGRVLVVVVRGDRGQEMMGLILEAIERMHKELFKGLDVSSAKYSYTDLVVRRFVLCNCQECRKAGSGLEIRRWWAYAKRDRTCKEEGSLLEQQKAKNDTRYHDEAEVSIEDMIPVMPARYCFYCVLLLLLLC